MMKNALILIMIKQLEKLLNNIWLWFPGHDAYFDTHLDILINYKCLMPYMSGKYAIIDIHDVIDMYGI